MLRPVHPVIKTTFHEETEKLANTNLLVKIKLILINSWICLQSFQWVDVGRGRYKRCHIYNSPAEIEKGKTLIRYKLNRSLPSQWELWAFEFLYHTWYNLSITKKRVICYFSQKEHSARWKCSTRRGFLCLTSRVLFVFCFVLFCFFNEKTDGQTYHSK